MLNRVLSCLTLLVLVLCAEVVYSANKTDIESHVTIRVAELPLPTSNDITAKARRAALKHFLEANPDIEVEPFSMIPIEGATIDAAPLMAIAAGLAPHVIYVNFRQSSTYIDHGFLEPLEILLARVQSDNPATRQADARGRWLADPGDDEVAYWLEQLRRRVPQPAWPVVFREAGLAGADAPHVWTLPTGTVVTLLLYRRDLFKEAGLDPDRPPRNWDEFADYARRLTVPQRGQLGLTVTGGPAASYGIYNLLIANGARLMEQNADGQWRASFDTRAAAETILYFAGLVYEGIAECDPMHVSRLAWRQGRVGMQLAPLDDELLSTINPQLIGVAPIPASHRGTRGNDINCLMLGVFAGASPEEKLAAMRYIWFTVSDEAKRVRTRTYVENGYGQFVNPQLLEQFGYERQLARVPLALRTTFRDAASHGVPEPYGRNTQFIYTFASTPINRALNAPHLHNLPEEEALRQIESWLKESADRFNTQFLGQVPDSVQRVRRLLGGLVFLVLVSGFVAALCWVWRSFGRIERGFAATSSRKKLLSGYMLLAPAVLLTVLWHYLPLVGGAWLSLTNYEIVLGSRFVGIDNFARALFDDRFWTSLGNTFYFVALMVGLGFWPPILLAILLDEVPTRTLKYCFRTIYYLPQIVSGIILIFLWRQFYHPSPNGYFNQILLSLNGLGPIAATLVKWLLLGAWLSLVAVLFWVPLRMRELKAATRASLGLLAAAMLAITLWPLVSAWLGSGQAGATDAWMARRGGSAAVAGVLGQLVGSFHLQPLGWTRSPETAMLCVVVPMIWATSGSGCIIYLAALKTVSHDMYEAATIDGAGIVQKIVYITLPRLKFLIVIQFIAAVIGAFKGGVDFILVMTAGGPEGATRILSLDIFERTFLNLEFGLGAAMAWLLGGFLILFTAWQMRLLSQSEMRSAAG